MRKIIALAMSLLLTVTCIGFDLNAAIAAPAPLKNVVENIKKNGNDLNALIPKSINLKDWPYLDFLRYSMQNETIGLYLVVRGLYGAPAAEIIYGYGTQNSPVRGKYQTLYQANGTQTNQPFGEVFLDALGDKIRYLAVDLKEIPYLYQLAGFEFSSYVSPKDTRRTRYQSSIFSINNSAVLWAEVGIPRRPYIERFIVVDGETSDGTNMPYLDLIGNTFLYPKRTKRMYHFEFAGEGALDQATAKAIAAEFVNVTQGKTVTSKQNHAPEASPTRLPQSAIIGQPFSYTLPTDLFKDPDNDTLSLSATELPPWLKYDIDKGTFTGTPPCTSSPQQINITVTATDPKGLSAKATLSLTLQSSLAISSTSNPLIINIDAVKNASKTRPFKAISDIPGSCPLVVEMPAGTYIVEVIGKSDGGAYDAWNRNNGKVQDCKLNKADQCAKGWEEKYVYDIGSQSTIVDGLNGRHDSAKRALATKPPNQKIPLTQSTNVTFYVNEDNPNPKYGNPKNNLGGVSLKITKK